MVLSTLKRLMDEMQSTKSPTLSKRQIETLRSSLGERSMHKSSFTMSHTTIDYEIHLPSCISSENDCKASEERAKVRYLRDLEEGNSVLGVAQ
jgi:hypothetical protein